MKQFNEVPTTFSQHKTVGKKSIFPEITPPFLLFFDIPSISPGKNSVFTKTPEVVFKERGDSKQHLNSTLTRSQQ